MLHAACAHLQSQSAHPSRCASRLPASPHRITTQLEHPAIRLGLQLALMALAIPLTATVWLVTWLWGLVWGAGPAKEFKSVVITGATSGIGEALAIAYAGPGVVMGLTGRNEKRLSTVAAAARSKGATVCTLAADVRDAETLRAWLLEFDADTPIDCLIANAGVSENMLVKHAKAPPSFEAVTKDVFDINMSGVLNTVLPVLQGMKDRGRGQIALMASLASFARLRDNAAYCATKAAVRVWGECLRADLAGYGVGVTVIAPGFVQSPMTQVLRHAERPMQWNMESAVSVIKHGVSHNHAIVAFPTLVYVLAWLVGMVIPTNVLHSVASARLLPAMAYRRPRKLPAD